MNDEPTGRPEFRALLELAESHAVIADLPPGPKRFLAYARTTLHVRETTFSRGHPLRRTPRDQSDLPWPGWSRKTAGELVVGDWLALGHERNRDCDRGHEVLEVWRRSVGVSVRTAAQGDIHFPRLNYPADVYDRATPSYPTWPQLQLLHAGEVALERLRLAPPEPAAPPVAALAPASAQSPALPATGTKFTDPADVPAAFRDGGDMHGDPLTAAYLADDPWELSQSELSRALTGGTLTTYVVVGRRARAFAYLYSELRAYRAAKTDRME